MCVEKLEWQVIIYCLCTITTNIIHVYTVHMAIGHHNAIRQFHWSMHGNMWRHILIWAHTVASGLFVALNKRQWNNAWCQTTILIKVHLTPPCEGPYNKHVCNKMHSVVKVILLGMFYLLWLNKSVCKWPLWCLIIQFNTAALYYEYHQIHDISFE